MLDNTFEPIRDFFLAPLYDGIEWPPKLQQAESHLRNALARFRPESPIANLKKHVSGEYKLTRPDTDNLQKLLKDCMTDLGFWVDDSLVCSEIIEKFWADTPGIYVKIEVLDG